MNYATDHTAIRSVTIASANSKVFTQQGPTDKGNGMIFKDLANSTPAAPVIAAKKLRDEKIDGVVHQVVVLNLSITLVDSVTSEPYTLTFTGTVKFPKKYTTNVNLAMMATAIWTMLASTGTAGTAGISSTAQSQLERAMFGALN